MESGQAARIVVGDWAALGAHARRVREDVFVREQGIPADLEWDASDPSSVHCVAYVDDTPVGTGRLLPDAHIGRMAVLAAHRNAGGGALMLARLVEEAHSRGDAEVLLSSQASAVRFYERHGFEAEGPPHVEVGIPHQRMRRVLRDGGFGQVRATEQRRVMPDGTELLVRDWTPRWPNGRGVYLLHGLGEHIGRYDALANWFGERGWRVRGHDHVGHGRSAGKRGVIARPAQLDEHATHLLDQYADELGAAPLLLGHSMGGALAAHLVACRGARVSALVLSSPALDAGLSGFQRLLLGVLERIAPELAVGNGLDPQQLSHDASVVKAYLEDPLVHDRVSGRLLRWLVDAGERSIAAAPALAVPTLLMVAGADRLVRPEGSRRFAQRSSAGVLTMQWYESMHHELFNEQPQDRQRVLSDLERWLEGR